MEAAETVGGLQSGSASSVSSALLPAASRSDEVLRPVEAAARPPLPSPPSFSSRSPGPPDAAPSTRIVRSNDAAWNASHQYPLNRISNTKYTLLSFLPLNLLQQCSQAMNRYFLLIALLQLWDYITPVNPVTTWIPLLVIFTISALKDAVDDWRRYKADQAANRRRVVLVTADGHLSVESQSLQCGDVVYVTEGEEFAADLVLLSSSGERGGCYIQTANLDGETNLKQRVALEATQRLTVSELRRLRCTVECALPNKNIYSFDSTLTLHPPHRPPHAARDSSTAPAAAASSPSNSSPQTYSLTTEQLLLQATQLVSTHHVYGLVVYTGNETKVGQNKATPRMKFTRLDLAIDRTIVALFSFQLLLIVCWGIVGSILLYQDQERRVWYLHLLELSWFDPFVIPLRFLLLASMMIPISLKVTVDVIKLSYSLFIAFDLQLYDETRCVPAEARNTAIAEELGCVQFIMSDKTGTLTENVMLMKQISVEGRSYGGGDEEEQREPAAPATAAAGRGGAAGGQHGSEADMDDLSRDAMLLRDVKEEEKDVCWLMRMLIVCNTVVPSRRTEAQRQRERRSPHSSAAAAEAAIAPAEFDYSSSSPDELCLVQFAASLGFVLEERTSQWLQTRVGPQGRQERWGLLAVCDFTSVRKRMSVLVRGDDGRIRLLMKGADDVMLARLAPTQSSKAAAFRSTLDAFARKGLRTLVFAHRELAESEWAEWRLRYEKAHLDVASREASLSAVYDEIERDCEIVGVTGIEDKLQDGVQETLLTLRQAGIRVWMLTGDKQQTAEEIGRSSGLITAADRVHYLNAVSSEELYALLASLVAQLSASSAAVSSPPPPYVLIIDGATLSLCLLHCPDELYRLSSRATSVICCRVTPSQKSSVTALINSHGHVTLAIGDGGNDCGMIQTANVGVGISGREGLQAARASDFSFSRFSYLTRLLLVHGRWSHVRSSWISQYCLYKSMIICLVQLGFAFESRFSGASFFDSLSIASYNIFYTSLIGVFFVFEQDLQADTLLAQPQLYATSREGQSYTSRTLALWFTRSVYQSAVISIITYHTLLGTTAVLTDSNQLAIALIAYSSIVFVQCFTLYAEMSFITALNHAIVWLTLVAFFVINIIASVSYSGEAEGIFLAILGDPVYWLSVLLGVVTCMLPVIGIKSLLRAYRPSAVDIAHEEEVRKKRIKSEHRRAAASLHCHQLPLPPFVAVSVSSSSLCLPLPLVLCSVDVDALDELDGVEYGDGQPLLHSAMPSQSAARLPAAVSLPLPACLCSVSVPQTAEPVLVAGRGGLWRPRTAA